MPDQRIEIEIVTNVAGSGIQKTAADVQQLKADTLSLAQRDQDTAASALEHYTENTAKLVNAIAAALERVAAASKSAAEHTGNIKANLEAVADQYALIDQVGGHSNPTLAKSKTAQVADVIIGEIDTGADDLDTKRRGLGFDSQVQFGLAMRQQGIVPATTPGGRGFGETPEVRAAIDRAQAETNAVGKAWADGIAKLRAYIESQNHALTARQQNKIE